MKKMLKLRELTTVDSFTQFTKLNPFFFPFLEYCMKLISSKLNDSLHSIITKIVESELKPQFNPN